MKHLNLIPEKRRMQNTCIQFLHTYHISLTINTTKISNTSSHRVIQDHRGSFENQMLQLLQSHYASTNSHYYCCHRFILSMLPRRVQFIMQSSKMANALGMRMEQHSMRERERWGDVAATWPYDLPHHQNHIAKLCLEGDMSWYYMIKGLE
uniref:Uncharacterized protein n=1 Tax=Arundo donax TaxID=35708 RepID=A0A0A8ZYU4_ARUDO